MAQRPGRSLDSGTEIQEKPSPITISPRQAALFWARPNLKANTLFLPGSSPRLSTKNSGDFLFWQDLQCTEQGRDDMRRGLRRENEARSTVRTSEFGRAEHRCAGAGVTGVRPASRLEGAANLPRPGRLRNRFEPACSQRTDDGLSTRIGRCCRGLEVRPICAVPKTADVWTRDVPRTWDRFCFGDGGCRYLGASRRIVIPTDRGRRPVRALAHHGTGEVGTSERPSERKSAWATCLAQAVAGRKASTQKRTIATACAVSNPRKEIWGVGMDCSQALQRSMLRLLVKWQFFH
jgi:hypothetical protein